ncbi:hypothetical protein Q4610_15925 [Sphingobium sp. HBC34]|uniref:Integral membrane protein n=1 Tax=Sphingobium cyanobacteriorum TaxID=3063954 RepID=A0ABT8ZPR4_9SPHN|nr:hypothetical protein [Sphingobium sp. HBC34]MDO7836535.1 hypothetical protein [Sphingobium sp. HBC34]
MSLAAERSKKIIYGAMFIIAIFALPLAALAALEGIFVWGSWEGRALAIRIAWIASPVLAVCCVGTARKKRMEGRFISPILLLSVVVVPTVAIIWWMVFIFRHDV